MPNRYIEFQTDAPHTPGQWQVEQWVENVCFQVWGNGMFICECRSEDDGTQARANARLIEAAPDLLQLCKDLEAEYRSYGQFSHALGRLRTVIAKAEGTEG